MIINQPGCHRNEIIELDNRLITVDKSYQREPDQKRIRLMADKFRPELVNIVKVSYRDGQYYCFDGNHTTHLLRLLNPEPDFKILCRVYYGMTREEEAELFALQTGYSKAVASAYKLRALEIAGYEEVVAFLEATRSCGFSIDPVKGYVKDGAIVAVKKANQVYDSLGEEQYKNMLCLIRDTWHMASWSVSQNMLGGMVLLFKTYGDKINRERFIRQLASICDNEIKRTAGKYDVFPVGYQVALAILEFYNKRGGKNILRKESLTLQLVGN